MREAHGNPSLDKPAERLGLAGAQALGPILKGLGGTISIETERGELLESARIYSDGSNAFEQDLFDLGEITHLAGGGRRFDADIVFGIHTDYGVTGAPAVRNYVEWTVLRRKIENQTSARAAEKALTRDDDTAISGMSDEQLRCNRGYFGQRPSYSRVATANTTGIAEASGLAWRGDAATLIVLSDDRKLGFFSRELAKIQDTITLPSSLGFTDTEAVVYMGSDRFAILDEGAVGSRPVRLHLLHIKAGFAPTYEDLITYDLSKVEEFAGGLGAEGLAYDRVSGKFYVGMQPTGDGQGGLWEIDIATKDSDGEPTQTLLWSWYDVLVAPGHLEPGAILGDLYYSHELADGQFRRSIFCHFRTPDGGGAQAMRRVCQVDIESGLFVEYLFHNLDGKWEGFTIADELEELFFCREGGGGNLTRYQHEEFEQRTTWRRQFFVKDKPASRGLYINSQEAQQGEAWVFCHPDDSNPYAGDATISINILPEFSDEFFRVGEWRGNLGEQVGLRYFVAQELVTLYGRKRPNRFAQTLRNAGGAKTVEVFRDAGKTPVISERLIEDLAGYYWPSPSLGRHTIRVRLRSEWGSSNYVDIVGYVRFRQFKCSD